MKQVDTCFTRSARCTTGPRRAVKYGHRESTTACKKRFEFRYLIDLKIKPRRKPNKVIMLVITGQGARIP